MHEQGHRCLERRRVERVGDPDAELRHEDRPESRLLPHEPGDREGEQHRCALRGELPTREAYAGKLSDPASLKGALDLYFDIHDHNIRTDDVEHFAADLLRRLPHGFILVMDRLPAHRSAARRLNSSHSS